MKKYINYRYLNGMQIIETVDELSLSDFKSVREFRAEVRRLVSEYNLAYGGGCYVSQRCTSDWNN